MGETLIKNIEYNFVSILLNRIGGLILTIILARFLSPELFGIYSLILSVTLLAMVFTDIGTNNAIIRYVSNAISKKKKKEAKEYFKYFLIVKLVIILISTILLILLGRIISNNIFDKPEMYYPLIVSALYVLLSPVGGIFSIFFYIKKEIRYTTKLETINQIIRIIFSILSVAILSDINKIAGIFLGFALASAYTIFYAIRFTRKHFGFIFKKVEKYTIDRKRALRFLGYSSLSSIGIVMLGSIDTLILGSSVKAEFVGFYRVALSLIVTAASLLNIAQVLLPRFSEGNTKSNKNILNKSLKYLIIIGLPCIWGLIILGKELISYIYGTEYILGFWALIILAPIIILMPITNVLINFFNGIEKPKKSAKAILFITIIDILLNYILIKKLSQSGELYSVIGASLGTTISYLIFVYILLYQSKKEIKFHLGIETIKEYLKPIIASTLMAVILFLISSLLSEISPYKLLLIPLGILIYSGLILLFRVITIQELKKMIFNRGKNEGA